MLAFWLLMDDCCFGLLVCLDLVVLLVVCTFVCIMVVLVHLLLLGVWGCMFVRILRLLAALGWY